MGFKCDNNIKSNLYTAKYIIKTSQIAKKEFRNDKVLMQFFHREEEALICGIEEIKDIFYKTIKKIDRKSLIVRAVKEGELVKKGVPVLTIEGSYHVFGHLEGIIDGILSRRTTVANNARKVVSATDKKIIFMGDRNDDYINQFGDGYAAYIGGIREFVTEANIKLLRGINNTIGTMPHALIQMCNGDILKACKLYKKHFPKDELVALVDYNNDCINDSLKVLKEFKDELKAVRVDTSISLIDKYIEKKYGNEDKKNYGVNPILIKELREKLDQNNGRHVKIIVSSGFDDKKIKMFERLNTPVDIYGVGSFLFSNTIGFTGDCVLLNGQPQSKEGRKYIENPNLEKITL